MSLNALEQLKEFTTVVADSGDLNAIRQFRPLDATTNPSLITAAAKQAENHALIDSAYQQAKAEHVPQEQFFDRVVDILTVKLGVEILKLIKGRVSTEVDATLSYDTQATVKKAKELLALYQQYGVDKSRILIKIASTWQGIQAAKQLEQEGIRCNLTLLFGLHQAQACAEAKVTLISPFVGRILDWYKNAYGIQQYPIEQDPGVVSVRTIYTYYKQQLVKTQVMGASFRSTEQVLALAGCDLLTISPSLLQQLEEQCQLVQPQLNDIKAQHSPTVLRSAQTEQSFHDELNADPMASELLRTGIQGFIQAKEQLIELLKQRYS